MKAPVEVLLGFVTAAYHRIPSQKEKEDRKGRGTTSERVFRSVNGMRMNPTPVLAVLPTMRSPAGDNLIFPLALGAMPLAGK